MNTVAWEASRRRRRGKTAILVFGIPVGLVLLFSVFSRIHMRAASEPPDVFAPQTGHSTIVQAASRAAAGGLVLGEGQSQVTSALGPPVALSAGQNEDGSFSGFQTWHYSVENGGDLWLILRNGQVVRILQTNGTGRTIRLERGADSPLQPKTP